MPHNNTQGHLGAANGLLPDDNKPLPGSMGTYKLIQVKLPSCSTCISDLNVRLFFLCVYVPVCEHTSTFDLTSLFLIK